MNDEPISKNILQLNTELIRNKQGDLPVSLHSSKSKTVI